MDNKTVKISFSKDLFNYVDEDLNIKIPHSLRKDEDIIKRERVEHLTNALLKGNPITDLSYKEVVAYLRSNNSPKLTKVVNYYERFAHMDDVIIKNNYNLKKIKKEYLNKFGITDIKVIKGDILRVSNKCK